MKLGYARVSTEDQQLDLQLIALHDAGCTKVFKDFGVSGSTMKRPGLESLVKMLVAGDTLVVWRLDRLGRSLQGVVQMVNLLGQKGIHFQSLNEAFDTKSSGGKLLFHIMAALAEFELSIISERTKAGMAAAKKKGKLMGRPPAFNKLQLQQIHAEVLHQGTNLAQLSKKYNVSQRTMRRYLKVGVIGGL